MRMRTFYEIAQSSPSASDGLINATIGGLIALIVIVIVLIIRVWKVKR